ncbi:MAG: hypothetical protein NC248_05425 [Bacteroides sp.]|nr:hypothetical protein [Bacteroides sp.]MCM1390192.1 hypothetical protein [Bacteroides sp.]
MTQSQKDHIIAGVSTSVIAVLLLLGLTMLYYEVDPAMLEDRTWPPVDSSEIVFGGEFVKLGDMPLPSNQENSSPAPESAPEEPTLEGTDLADAGAKELAAEQLVSTETESTMEVDKKPVPEKTGPTKEEIAEQQRIKRQREEAEKQAKIKNRMKSGFSSSKKGSGTPGAKNGNASTGALSGAPGHTLKGRTAQSWGRPKSTMSGSVQVKVRVNRKGYVVGNPEIVGGTAPAASSSAVRQSCIEASRNSRFSVSLEAPAEQVGIITWKFE